MTTDRAALMDAGRAYLERWSVWLRQNPDADPVMVEAAMQRGDPPPELTANEFGVDTAVFEDSPLAAVYYNVKNELKERHGRSAAAHHRIALWAAWEAHKTAKDSHGVSLLRLVGLPETQKAFAEFLGVSDRTVRNYRDEYGEFVGTAQTMTFNRLLADYRLDAAQALGQVATDKAHPQFAQSQRTFFTLTGDLVEKAETKNTERDWRDEVVEMLINGRITADDVANEFSPEDAKELIARANLARRGGG